VTAVDWLLPMDDLRALGRALAADSGLRAIGHDAAAQRRVWDLAVQHWLHLCLAWRVAGEAGASWADSVRRDARAMLAEAAVLEELQRRELCAVISALTGAWIPALLLKGAAWVYQVYPMPMLRSREDTDLLINAADRDRVAQVLLARGYEPAAENTAELATAQRHYRRMDVQQFLHPIDVHWRVTNPLVFADALPFARVWPRSVPIAALGGAPALCLVDALLLACLHRLAHHGDDSNLIWVYDIHWLATRLTADEWKDLVEQAAANGLSGVCRQGLSRSMDVFGTIVPTDILSSLAACVAGADAAFLHARVGPLRMLASDWRTMGSWRGRMRLLGAHVFPEREYMASKYGTKSPLLLPLLYAHRALTGLPRWLRQ